MAFPTTGILDSFNRADSATLGGNWTEDIYASNDVAAGIFSNQARVQSVTFGSAWLNNANYGPNCEAYFTLVNSLDALFWDPYAMDLDAWYYQRVQLFLRLQQPGSAGTADAYMFLLSGGLSDAGGIWYYRIDNQVLTVLGVNGEAVSQATGDQWGFEANGSNLKAYRKPSGGSWAAVGSGRTDNTYNSAGRIGFYLSDETAADILIDDFGGGTIVDAPAVVPHRFPPRRSRGTSW